MYKRIPFKIKVIVLGTFCIIGIIIVFYNAKLNWQSDKLNYNTKQHNASNIKSSKVDENKSLKDSKENEEKQKEEEKQKQLNDLCEQGYNDFGAKKYSDAIDKENEVLTQDDNNYRAHAIKGIALCYLGASTYKQGIEEIDRSLQIKPDYGYGTFNKALALELYGHYDDALNWYDKDLKIENRVWSYYGKASIYGRKGDVENTVKNLKIAIDMQNNIRDVAREEEDFANVRNSPEFNELVK